MFNDDDEESDGNEEINSRQYDTPLDHIVYDLSGFMLHARRRQIDKLNCQSCWNSLKTQEDLLPDSFFADSFTVLKCKGGLKKATQGWFEVIKKVEVMLQKLLSLPMRLLETRLNQLFPK